MAVTLQMQETKDPVSKDSVSKNPVSMPIIGYHRSPLTQKFGIPRQPNLVAVTSHIVMQPPYATPDAFVGIEAFSHLWISWQTHHNKTPNNVDAAEFKPKVRPPRLGGNAKLGVFATRSTYRPSQLGLSVVKLLAVEVEDGAVVLQITGADMVDGTPIIDIKPYLGYSDAITDAVCGYAPAKPVSKTVQMSEVAQQQLQALQQNQFLHTAKTDTLLPEDIDIICALIAQDPRPAYRQGDTKRVFIMRYKQYDIHFMMTKDGNMHIVSVIAIAEINNP